MFDWVRQRRSRLVVVNFFIGCFMSQKNLVRIFALGSLLLGLFACDSGTDVLVPGPDSSAGTSDGGKVSSSEEPAKPGSSSSYGDSIRTIDEHGDTIYIYDTIPAPKDTTPHWVGKSAIVITEISPLNLSWQDEDGDDPAWVELYNAGDEAANLKGYSLVESREKPRKWVFGDEIIAAKSFRIVFCDKKNVTQIPDGGESEGRHFRLHTNWKIEKDGGTVYLFDKQYGIRDSVNYPAISAGDVSWGITDGGIWKFFDKPTPEAPNTNSKAYDGMAPAIDLSQIKGGFFNDQVTIPAPSLPSGVKLRCTQDGSVPTSNSQEFNSPMTFNQSTTLRCAVFKEGALTKEVVTKTFFVNQSVRMPVVAISVDPQFFHKHYIQPEPGHTNASNPDGAPSGLYEDVEFPVHVEYFEKGSSSDKPAWEIEAGISMMGNYSRLERKKSVAIVMREEYQDGWLHYSLFDTRKSENDKYKAFNLRNNGNRFVSDYFADALGGAILEGSGVDYQRSRQVVVYYNGKYFGIHDMRERFNKNYVESNYGIDASTVNMVKHLTEKVTASNGTPDDYIALLDYAAANDFSGENNDKYEFIKTMMDVGNFADYMAAEMYIHNGDWPNNNVRAWRTPDQTWKFMVYDLDHGFKWDWNVDGFGESTNMFKWVKQGGRPNGKCHTESDKDFTGDKAHCFHVLYTRLIKNPDFKRLFINHSAVMLKNYLNVDVVEKVRSKMAGSIDEAEAERDLKENGQKDRGYNGFTVSNSDITDWSRNRDDEIVRQYQEEFDIGGMVTVTIKSSGSGMVLMEGMKLPKSTESSTDYSGKFFSGNEIELTAVPSGGAVFDGWSGCTAVEGKPETCRASITDGLTITAKFK